MRTLALAGAALIAWLCAMPAMAMPTDGVPGASGEVKCPAPDPHPFSEQTSAPAYVEGQIRKLQPWEHAPESCPGRPIIDVPDMSDPRENRTISRPATSREIAALVKAWKAALPTFEEADAETSHVIPASQQSERDRILYPLEPMGVPMPKSCLDPQAIRIARAQVAAENGLDVKTLTVTPWPQQPRNSADSWIMICEFRASTGLGPSDLMVILTMRRAPNGYLGKVTTEDSGDIPHAQ